MSPITLDTIHRMITMAFELGYGYPLIRIGRIEEKTLRQIVHMGRDGMRGFPVRRFIRHMGGDIRVSRVRSCLSIEPMPTS